MVSVMTGIGKYVGRLGDQAGYLLLPLSHQKRPTDNFIYDFLWHSTKTSYYSDRPELNIDINV